MCRMVLLQWSGFKMFLTVQMLPWSEAGLKQSLANDNGEDTPLNCQGIPYVNFTRADKGLGGGVAKLVPQVSQIRVLPMIQGEGSVVPALANMKLLLVASLGAETQEHKGHQGVGEGLLE